jgi:ethanolamine ammonia-lyase large subunit
MGYQTTIRGERFIFADLREVFARANEEKSGDQLAGLAARSERERVAAKMVLADVPLGDIVDRPLLDPDEDDVSRLLLDTLDHEAFAQVRGLTVGELREYLLDDAVGSEQLQALQRAILPEVAAATAK